MDSSLATTLTPVTVSILLDYISPLSQELPAHLLSQPLLQRHHFLDIQPSDPVQYLSWPSSDQQQAFRLLESYGLDQKHSESEFCIRYTADHESFSAHVELGSSGVRLVFQWDSRDQTWKYHNCTLMPFPLPSYDSVAEAQQNLSLAGAHETNEITDEDAYWESYGQDDDYKPNARVPSTTQTDTQAEDAYWAQYASVQGTADSTIPSPLINAKRKALPQDDPHGYKWPENTSNNGEVPSYPQRPTDNVFDIPYSSLDINPSTYQFDPHSPPSARELSNRLSALSPLHDEAVRDKHVNGTAKPTDPAATTREAIRGIYGLWKLSSSPMGILNGESKERFLELVRQAIE